jgi:pimeloyl-ACP methyl ester carboxylesterase
MYQRLLFILLTLTLTGSAFSQSAFNSGDSVYQYKSTAPAGSLQNPTFPNIYEIRKWVHDTTQPGKNRIHWDQSKFKCYATKGPNGLLVQFRLRFPNNYDSTNPAKYPLVLFLHGGGEAGNTYENQDQLFWGAQTFEQRINAGEWNGFLLFPQEPTVGWDNNYFPGINVILDSLQQSCAFDPDRVIGMGLSEGGYNITYASLYPTRMASMVLSNPKDCKDQLNASNSHLSNFLQIPVWEANGGLDGGPTPSDALYFQDSIKSQGGNVFETYYPTQGHSSWNTQWGAVDQFNKFIVSKWWNAAHKAQPLVYFQKTDYCSTETVSTKLGITAGFNAYEWQYDGGGGFATIPGATSNTFTATQAGTYRVHFQRTPTSAWSAWTPSPVVITVRNCSLDTAFVEHFNEAFPNWTAYHPSDFSHTAYFYDNTYKCQNGIFTGGTETFATDATGILGNRFMINNTGSTAGCTYLPGDMVWKIPNTTPITVTPNTDYVFSFYLGNVSTGTSTPTNPAQIIPFINGVNLVTTGVSVTEAGQFSWKKYSYVWNSGSATTADIGISNGNANTNGNDFAIDEISLIKYHAPATPGGIGTNLLLWSRAGNVKAVDNSLLGQWLNEDVNSSSLQQVSTVNQPVYKNNAAENINFNPIISFTATGTQRMQVTNGFVGNTTHTAAHAFMVMKSNNITQGSTVLNEAGASSTGVQVSLSTTGNITWIAGSNSTNSITVNQNEANKPILWSFSKDNVNNTASNNKQDIRKNGITIGTNNTAGTFTGNSSFFTLGSTSTLTGLFDGKVAEVVYYIDANINAVAQNKIESYLALKYGITLGSNSALTNYTSSTGTVFWTASTPYQNDIFGIGTDSASNLVQIKSNSANSGSGDGTGQSTKGNLVLTTNTVLNNNQFLLIGNDAGSFANHVILPGEAPLVLQGAIRVTRKWRADNTGSVGAVDISFDTTGLALSGGALLSNYTLLVDNDGDGNLNTGTLTYNHATSMNGKKMLFAGVTMPDNAIFFIITTPSPNASLPAVWVSFTAEAVNGDAVLNWKTTDEVNVARYEIEHSTNGTNFKTVGSVSAKNNSGLNQYTFTDPTLAAGVHYYRIRRVDIDGRAEYSVVKTLKIANGISSVSIRPNPVVGSTLTLAVTLQQNSRASIHIVGMDGKLIMQQNASLTPGVNTLNVDVTRVPAGIYLVQVQLDEELVTKKFVKLR